MNNEYYSAAIQRGGVELFALGDYKLESGTLLKNAHLAYQTAGQLNKKRDNAILFPHMYSGNSQHMRDIFVGANKALDPEKYFIIFPNQLGNGLSTSPHNAHPEQSGARFPDVSIGDDVVAQHALVRNKFEIDRLQLVLGWSMGAQQTYEWAVRFPRMIRRAAPIAGTARTTAYNLLYTRIAAEALKSDAQWASGNYPQSNAVALGLRRHANIFALMGASTQLYKDEGWRQLGFESLDGFLAGFWENWFAPMDANNLLCMLSKWQRADVARHAAGNLPAALSRITAKTFVIAFEEDMFMPVRDCVSEQALIRGAEIKVLPSQWGHFTPLVPLPGNFEPIDRALRELLSICDDSD